MIENDNNMPIEEWFDKQNKPSFEYLQSLVDDGNPRAIELLREIADRFDAPYAEDTEPDELVELIVMAMKGV